MLSDVCAQQIASLSVRLTSSLQVLGLHAVGSVESPALTQQDGQSLALRVHWQAAAEVRALAEQKIAVHLGQLYASYAPGLLTELRAYLIQAWSPQEPRMPGSSPPDAADTQRTGARFSSPALLDSRGADRTAGYVLNEDVVGSPFSTESGSGDQRGEEQTAQGSESHLSPPAWLAGGIALSASALSLQLALLSSQAAAASALCVSIERCSVHLGPLKPAARPGSLLAQLFSLQKQALPRIGLRASLSGVQLSVATQWRHAACRAGEAEAVLVAAEALPVSDPVDVLALVNTTPPRETAGETPESEQASGSWVLSAAVSPLNVQLSGLQLAAGMAAAQGAQAEIARSFLSQLPKPPKIDDGREQQVTWLSGAAVRVTGLWLLHSPLGAAQLAAKLGNRLCDSQLASISSAETIELSAQSTAGKACLSATIREPTLAAGPGMQLDIPVLEVGAHSWPPSAAACQSEADTLSREAQPTDSSHPQAAHASASPELPVLYLQDMAVSTNTSSAMDDDFGGTIAISLDAATFAMSSQQQALLVTALTSPDDQSQNLHSDNHLTINIS